MQKSEVEAKGKSLGRSAFSLQTTRKSSTAVLQVSTSTLGNMHVVFKIPPAFRRARPIRNIAKRGFAILYCVLVKY